MNTMTAICPICGYQHDTDAKGFNKLHEEWASRMPAYKPESLAEILTKRGALERELNEARCANVINVGSLQRHQKWNQELKDDKVALTAERDSLAEQLEEAENEKAIALDRLDDAISTQNSKVLKYAADTRRLDWLNNRIVKVHECMCSDTPLMFEHVPAGYGLREDTDLTKSIDNEINAK